MEIEEEKQVDTKKVTCSFDDNKKEYSFDIDSNITFHTLKKIISASAHLLKNSFTVCYGQVEYTKESDDFTIKHLFGEINPIPLKIIINKGKPNINEIDKKLTKISLNSNALCTLHIGKYELYYCYTCKKSICFECFGQFHGKHTVEEKANYLAPTKIIIDKMFNNSQIKKQDISISEYNNCHKFLSNIKYNIFSDLRQLLDNLEKKIEDSLLFFASRIKETQSNINKNIDLLKEYSTDNFIEFKQKINSNDIMVKDEIFLSISNKVKELDKLQSNYSDNILSKYDKLNKLLFPFVISIQSVLQKAHMLIAKFLDGDLYDKFKENVQKNCVPELKDETFKKLIIKKQEDFAKDSNSNNCSNKENLDFISSNNYNDMKKIGIENNLNKNYSYDIKDNNFPSFILSQSIKKNPVSSLNNNDGRTEYEKKEISQFNNTQLNFESESNDININNFK